jgi:hypothetical protein
VAENDEQGLVREEGRDRGAREQNRGETGSTRRERYGEGKAELRVRAMFLGDRGPEGYRRWSSSLPPFFDFFSRLSHRASNPKRTS